MKTQHTPKQWKLSGLRDNSFSVGAVNHRDDAEMANALDSMLSIPTSEKEKQDMKRLGINKIQLDTYNFWLAKGDSEKANSVLKRAKGGG